MHDLSTLVVVDLGGETFLLGPKASSKISLSIISQRYVAATVIHWDGDKFDSDDAERISNKFSALDDVWNYEFFLSEV